MSHKYSLLSSTCRDNTLAPRILHQASMLAGSFKMMKIMTDKHKASFERPVCFTPKLESPEKRKQPALVTTTMRSKKSTSTKY